MVVPIDLLPPILNDLLAYGRVEKPPRPWLGIYAAENAGKIFIAGVDERGPAAAAGLREGDIISAIRDSSVDSLGDFYREILELRSGRRRISIEVVRDKRG